MFKSDGYSLFNSREYISSYKDITLNKRKPKLQQAFWYKDRYNYLEIDYNMYYYNQQLTDLFPMKPRNPYAGN